MNAPQMSHDPHGYGRLKDFLGEIERILAASGNETESQLVHHAGLFFGGGSPSEFLGEARLALLSTLHSAHDVPVELVERIHQMICAIDEGFRDVGGA